METPNEKNATEISAKIRKAFIGRYSPFHKGHLEMMLPYKNNPITVLVMESKPEDIYNQDIRAAIIWHRLKDLGFTDYEVHKIPLCDEFIIGRDVGYKITQAKETKNTSGTEIRKSLA